MPVWTGRAAQPTALAAAAAARGPAALQGALRRAAGDPELLVLLPDADGWVDVSGLPAAGPGASDARRTPVPVQEQGGALLGVLLVDAERCDDPVVELVVSTALRVLAAQRLGHQLEVARTDLEQSQARLLAASDLARQHVREVLEAGVLRRLRRARSQLSRIPTDPLLPEIREQLDAASAEIAALATGVHPASLQQGLGRALRELAARVPQRVRVHDARCGPVPEACARVAWYAVAEALTNAAKHAPGAPVGVWLRTDGATLTVRVVDQGPGGADPSGAGLVGLGDRVETCGGTLVIDSVEAGDVCGGRTSGTSLHVTLPLVVADRDREAPSAPAERRPAPLAAEGPARWRWLPTLSLLPLLAWAWWTWPTQFDPFAPDSVGRTPGRALDVVFVLGVGAVGAYLTRAWTTSGTGPLLASYAWICFLDDLDFAHGSWWGVLGSLSRAAGGVLFLLIVLAYPAAWVRRRAERRVLTVHALLTFVLGGIGSLLFFDTEDLLCGPECAPDGNPLNVVNNGAEVFVPWAGPVVIGGKVVVTVVALVLLSRRVRAATRRGRAVLLPLVLPWSVALAAVVPVGVYDVIDILRRSVLGGGDWLPSVEGLIRIALAANQVALAVVPLGYFLGMRRLLARRHRLSGLAGWPSGADLDERVQAVLDDPQAHVLPGDETAGGPGRTPLVAAGVRVGTLQHDPALEGEPALLHAAAALLALAVAQDQLTARLQGELVQARESRERLLHEERRTKRRIERDLHDGAQQRLVAVQAALGLLDSRQAQAAAGEVAAALTSLRVLARGLAPPALELGLVAALTALGDRTRVPLRITGEAEGLARDVADAAYDVLALLVDSAAAEQVHVDLSVDADQLRITVQPPLVVDRGALDLLEAEGGSAQLQADALDLALPTRRVLVAAP